jgi:hypothetical protein
MAPPREIAVRRVYNIGNYETISLEMSWSVADPDKTLRSSEEEMQIASLCLVRQINALAMSHLVRIHSIRSNIPHPNLELREHELTLIQHTYNQCLTENQAIDAELASLRNGHHQIQNGSTVPVNPPT